MRKKHDFTALTCASSGTPQLPSTSFLQSPIKNPRKELKREDLVKRNCSLFFFEPIYLQKHRPFQAPELWK